jgi:hypothetical protein
VALADPTVGSPENASETITCPVKFADYSLVT